jgi:hypothetical protein
MKSVVIQAKLFSYGARSRSFLTRRRSCSSLPHAAGDRVDVKLTLSKDSQEYKDLKASMVKESQMIGYDDNAVKTDIGATLTKNLWRLDHVGNDYNYINVYRFDRNSKVSKFFSSNRDPEAGLHQIIYGDIPRDAASGRGTWSIRDDGTVDVKVRLKSDERVHVGVSSPGRRVYSGGTEGTDCHQA